MWNGINLHKEELSNSNFSSGVVRVITCIMLMWAKHLARMEISTSTFRIDISCEHGTSISEFHIVWSLLLLSLLLLLLLSLLLLNYMDY